MELPTFLRRVQEQAAGLRRQRVGLVEEEQQRLGVHPLGQCARQPGGPVRAPQPDGDAGHGDAGRRETLERGNHPQLDCCLGGRGNVHRSEPVGREAVNARRFPFRPPEERGLAVAARAVNRQDRRGRRALREHGKELPEEGLFLLASREIRRMPSESRSERTTTARSAHDGRSIGIGALPGSLRLP